MRMYMRTRSCDDSDDDDDDAPATARTLISSHTHTHTDEQGNIEVRTWAKKAKEDLKSDGIELPTPKTIARLTHTRYPLAY